MVSFLTIVKGLGTLLVLPPCLASGVGKQSFFGGQYQAHVAESSSNPACEDVFHATMYVPHNATDGKEDLPVVHENGRLYAKKHKKPTQWTIQKNNNGGYNIFSVHPSGVKHFWAYSYDDTIALNAQEYSAKQVYFAQAEKTDSPFSRVTVYWDDRCLVIPDNHPNPLLMLQLSACDTLILKIGEPVEWKNPSDLCEKNEEKSIKAEWGGIS